MKALGHKSKEREKVAHLLIFKIYSLTLQVFYIETLVGWGGVGGHIVFL